MKTCATCGAAWPDDTKFCPSDGSPLRAAEGTSLIGSIIDGKFHILEKLGEGGMGAVYLGEHVKMGRKSAIKVLTQSLAQDTEAIARFNREAANAARISHSNVCAIYDFGETTEGVIFLAMEYVDGESLSDILAREGPLEPHRAATITHQVGDALQAAHDLGIVHRDLKPDNIMITKGRDGCDVVKVVDFGIAKAMGGEEGQKVTRTGLVVGTPEYMSPEQLSGDLLDGRSDIYSLALVLFRILTGRLPFEADNAQEVMIKRLTDEPTRLNDAMPGANFPARLQDVLDRALERMPADRYVKASDFAKDVVQAVSGVPSAAASVDAATQLLGFQPQDQGVTERLKQTRISQPAPTVAVGDRSYEARRPPTTPETPLPRTRLQTPATKKKRPAVMIAASTVIVATAVGVVAVTLTGGENGRQAASQDSTQLAALAPPPGTPPESTLQSEPEGAGRAGQPDVGGRADQQGGARRVPALRPESTAAVPPEVIDEAALEQELIMLGRQVGDPEGIDTTRRRLLDIFETAALSRTLRGRAAQIMAESYELSDMARACEWIDRAIVTDSTNETFRMYKETILSCQS